MNYPEKFYSIKEAADRLGLKYHHLLKAVRKGVVPTYRLLNSKRLVLISDVRSAMIVIAGDAA